MKNGEPYTCSEVYILRTMWAAGKSPREIGKRLRRRADSIRRCAGRLGLPRRDPTETEHLDIQSAESKVENIQRYFRHLRDRLDALGRETDQLARDMGVTLAVALFLVVAAAPAWAADLWHIWPAGTESHRKDLAGTWQPKGVLLYDFHAEPVTGGQSYYVRAADLDAAKAAVRALAGNVEFTRQPFKRPPSWWVPNFYVVPACQHLRGIMFEERDCR